MFMDKTTSQKKKAPEERNGKENSAETFRSFGAANISRSLAYKHFVPLGREDAGT